MPWRSRPQAAFATTLLWACPLVAVEGMLCATLSRDPKPVEPETFTCVTVRSDRWNLLPGVEYTGRISVDLAPAADGAMLLIVGDHQPIALEAESMSGVPVPLAVKPIQPVTLVPPDYWLDFGGPWNAPTAVVAARIGALPEVRRKVAINLGRRAPRVLARLAGYHDDARGRVCAMPIAQAPAFVHTATLLIEASDHEHFASGWAGLAAGTGGAQVRRMRSHGAVLVRSGVDGDVRVRLRAASTMPPAAGDATLRLSANGVFHAAPVAMRHEVETYEWLVPSSAWLVGTNELLFSVALQGSTVHGPRSTVHGPQFAVGLALYALTLELERHRE